MDLHHPQLNKRHFFKVYKSGMRLWSFIYSVLAAIYSHIFHRNGIHYKATYFKFIKNLDLASLNFNRGTIKDLKKFLKQHRQLNITVSIYEGRLSPNSDKLQVWKYGKLR